MTRILKRYNSNLISFLSTNNTVLIKNQYEYVQMQRKMASIGLIMNDCCPKMPIALEYDNSRGFTHYDDIQKSIDWYGQEPFSIEDLEI